METKKDKKRDIEIRLSKIQGQVKGIANMVDNESCCKDVLIQIAAVRSALNKVGALILENYAKRCFKDDKENSDYDEKIDTIVKTLNMFMK